MKALGKEPFFHRDVTFENCQFGEFVEIGAFNTLENAKIGNYSYSCANCIIQNARVGNFSNIAASVRIGPTNHPMHRASQHHFTYRRTLYGFDQRDDVDFFNHRENQLVVIGHDTWLGHGVIVLPNVKIGTGAVIGSGSVVTKDIPEYAIALGNPAKVIRYRFEEKIQEELLQIAWWEWSHQKIKKALPLFTADVESFIEEYREVKEC